nr:Gag-Pol polyprotein [Tanacetum cinerariifolium]
MTTPNVTSSTDSQMHNNIMVAGSRDRPSMLATGRYSQWRSRFLRYIDTRPNGEALRKFILSGPYKPTTVLVQAVEAIDDSSAIPEHTTVETPMNMSPENKAHFLAEKEAIHLILTRIGDEIYSTVDACQTAGSRDHPPMLATGRYSQWRLRFLRYIDTRPNGEALRKCLLSDPYKPTTVLVQAVDATDDSAVIPEHTTFGNQRTVNVAGAREKVGSLVVQQYGIQCFNYKELEAHYRYMAKIQEVPTADSGTDSEPLEHVQNDAGYNVFANELQHFEQSESNDQNDVESVDERVALANLIANLIANLKLDVDENKKIQKQLKKANTTLAQELKECKTILAKTSKSLVESVSVRDSFLVALQTKQAEFEKYKAFNDHTVDYDKLERNLNETLGQLALKYIEIKEGLKTKAYEISVVKHKHDELMKQSLLTKSHYEGLVKQKTKVITDLKLREEHDIEKMLSMEKQLKFLNEVVYKRSQSIQTIYMMQEMHADLKYVESLEKEIDELESDKAEFSDMYDVILQECVSKDVMCSYLMSLSDLDALDELQCLYLHKTRSVPKTNVAEGLSKPVTAQTLPQTAGKAGNDLLTGNRGSDLYTIYLQESTSSTPLCLMAKATPTQAWLWHRRLSYLNFNYINLLSKKDIVIGLPKLKYVNDQLCSSYELIKAKRSSFKSKAVPSSKGRLNLLHMDLCGPMRVASINGKKYILSKGYRVYNKRTRMIVESIHVCFDEIKEVREMSIANNTSGLVPQRQKALDYENPDPVPQRQDVCSSAEAYVPSQQVLDLLFGPLYDEFVS